MTFPPLGVALAVVGAFGWAVQYVCIRIGTDHETGAVAPAMVVALVTNVLIVVPLAAVWHYPDYGVTPTAVAAFATAGLLGSVIARITQFASTTAIGASRTAPVVTVSAVFSAAAAVVFLGERLTPVHAAGIALVVLGVIVISTETTPDDANGGFREAGAALVLPLLSAVALGAEPLFVKTGFAQGTPMLVGLALMVASGTVGYLGYLGVSALRDPTATRRLRRGLAFQSPPFRWYLGAGLGSTVALLGYFASLAALPVVVVIPILQAAPLIVVGLSKAFVPERLERITPRLMAAAAVVVVGTTVVSLAA